MQTQLSRRLDAVAFAMGYIVAVILLAAFLFTVVLVSP